MEKITIGISSCLLGEKVRFDGGHKHDRYITDTLGQFFQFVSVCPEVEYGLPVPREAMHLAGDHANPRLVTVRTDIDHTEGMQKWAKEKLNQLENENLSGFIFKSKSPSSGMQGVKVYTGPGSVSKKGVGIFANAFMNRFPLLPVEDDGRLHDPLLRENFIERVFVFGRWQKLIEKKPKAKDLVDFHRDHKFLILAHSPRHYTALGRLVASAGHGKESLFADYFSMLTGALRLIATVKKNTNVLTHLAGYFKRLLSHDEKQELAEVIDQYRRGLLPLIVPVTLIKHYTRKYDEPYLKGQYYLNPHPVELMLRNHV